VSWRL